MNNFITLADCIFLSAFTEAISSLLFKSFAYTLQSPEAFFNIFSTADCLSVLALIGSLSLFALLPLLATVALLSAVLTFVISVF